MYSTFTKRFIEIKHRWGYYTTYEDQKQDGYEYDINLKEYQEKQDTLLTMENR